ncbi:response regulator [Solidesulfovibrio sp.]
MKRPSNVLVADDNYICRLVLGKMLKNDGHSVTMATNGIECINLCSHMEFDYIFIDYFMPEMNGVEAAAEITSISRQKNLNPKIYLTSAADHNHLAALGMPLQLFNGFVTKPIDKIEVLSLVNSQS